MDINKIRNFNEYTNKITLENTVQIIDVFNLSRCNNPYLKTELAYFITKKEIDKKRASTKEGYINNFRHLIEFFNIISLQYNSVSSILDFEIEALENEYKLYLQSQDIRTTKTVKDLLSSMEEVSREYRSEVLSTLLYVYRTIEDYVDSLDKPYFERDIWNLRDFPFKIDTRHTSKENFEFRDICQVKIRYLAKKYIYNRLQYQSPSTCQDRLIIIRKFSKYLHEFYPNIKSLRDVTYEMVEEYYIWLGVVDTIGRNRRGTCISQLEKFFNFTLMMQWDECLDEQIIFDFDTSEIRNINPTYLTNDELRNLNAHLDDMEITLARMVMVLESVGMRITECCLLEQGCTRTGMNNQHYIKYYQYKTKKENNVPISEEVYLTVESAIEYTQKKFNNYTHVFLNTQGRPFIEETFSSRINKICYKFQIRNKDGNILHIKPNVFRGTVVTQYVDLGLDLELIRKLIGQSSLGAIYHYFEANEVAMLEYMDPLIEDREKNILTIGNRGNINSALEIVDEDAIPLSNGYCSKKLSTGICDKANTCYECAMFKPTPQHYSVYTAHLYRLRQNILIAEINGFERQIQVNKRTEKALVKIIRSINSNFEFE